MTKKQKIQLLAATLGLVITVNTLGSCTNQNYSNNSLDGSTSISKDNDMQNIEYEDYVISITTASKNYSSNGLIEYRVPKGFILIGQYGYLVQKEITKQVAYPAEEYDAGFGKTGYRTTRGGRLSGDREIVTEKTYEILSASEAEEVLNNYSDKAVLSLAK